ncbi:M20 family metallopeptidase [Bacillus sp. FJAT-47783]|uniref:M20 family metallopeptidase n=1 Tax=Bacillus sp. FJAT-47783 TaxID=2922712 RepID=UPI001FAC8AC5|nr:M20 family metallopeptidase [Bacillus sp. FJAT-47783]
MNFLNEESLLAQLKKIETDLHFSLRSLVSIPSVLDDASPNKPFGDAIQAALEYTLIKCEELGFKTYMDPKGYYGYAEIGEGEEMVGILGHLDVVPPGNIDHWTYHPFNPVIKEGKMYGRGTQDDKGPTLAAIYAAKALMDLGVTFKKRLRFIFGTDEETLWRCMKQYEENEEMPSYGFVPDASFPLTYAEKGLLQLYLVGENTSGLHIRGGSAFNAVPDRIHYNGPKQEELAKALFKRNFQFEKNNDGITVIGKSAHAQVPEEGINAICCLAIALKDIDVQSKAIQFIANEIGEDPYATKIFNQCQDDVSGKLKFNIGKIELSEKEIVSIDIRIPVTKSKNDIVKKLTKVAAQYGLEYQEFDWLKSIYIPTDHFLVKTLMEVYQEETGDTESTPISAGGATYARAVKNSVAFGAVFPGKPKVEHQPNEYVDLADLFKAMKIYSKAIYQLTR